MKKDFRSNWIGKNTRYSTAISEQGILEIGRLCERPLVVTLVGSSRFQDKHIEVIRELTMQGMIVIPLGLYGHMENLDMDGPTKKMLDELHLCKIECADLIFVINETRSYCSKCNTWADNDCYPACECPDMKIWEKRQNYIWKPYIGNSTKREIEYAESLGKVINYLHPME